MSASAWRVGHRHPVRIDRRSGASSEPLTSGAGWWAVVVGGGVPALFCQQAFSPPGRLTVTHCKHDRGLDWVNPGAGRFQTGGIEHRRKGGRARELQRRAQTGGARHRQTACQQDTGQKGPGPGARGNCSVAKAGLEQPTLVWLAQVGKRTGASLRHPAPARHRSSVLARPLAGAGQRTASNGAQAGAAA